VSRNSVVPIRPTVAAEHVEEHPVPSSGLLGALDELEQAASDAGVLYVDVVVQLALARHVVAIVASITLGTEPTVAQVHAIRELRLAITELRQLVAQYARHTLPRR
jgi:hypothetical protein